MLASLKEQSACYNARMYHHPTPDSVPIVLQTTLLPG